jgi:hypothetical protein
VGSARCVETEPLTGGDIGVREPHVGSKRPQLGLSAHDVHAGVTCRAPLPRSYLTMPWLLMPIALDEYGSSELFTTWQTVVGGGGGGADTYRTVDRDELRPDSVARRRCLLSGQSTDQATSLFSSMLC